jgi:hypothetical protein
MHCAYRAGTPYSVNLVAMRFEGVAQETSNSFSAATSHRPPSALFG